MAMPTMTILIPVLGALLTHGMQVNVAPAWTAIEGLDEAATSDEIAYRTAALWRSNAEMNTFIRKVIMAHGGKITDKDAFHGLVPYYSGVAGVQSYENLIEELSSASWVEGADWLINDSLNRAALDVAFDEEGYQAVAMSRSNVDMSDFISKVVSAYGGKIRDTDALHGLVPYYSGMRGVQNLHNLLEELARAPWIEFDAATFDEAGYETVASWRSNAEMNFFIRKLILAHGGNITDTDALHGLVPFYSGAALPRLSYAELLEELSSASWIEKADWSAANYVRRTLLDVTFDETGYQAVAARKSNSEMNSFIRRIAMARGAKITDAGALQGLVPYYSGVAGVQSYDTLVKELEGAPWIEMENLNNMDWGMGLGVTSYKDEENNMNDALGTM